METFGGVTAAGHKTIKGLSKNHRLRDHMTDLELIFTMLAEASTTEIAKAIDARFFKENAEAARSGGQIAGQARAKLETRTKRDVVSTGNHLGGRQRVADPHLLSRPSGE